MPLILYMKRIKLKEINIIEIERKKAKTKRP